MLPLENWLYPGVHPCATQRWSPAKPWSGTTKIHLACLPGEKNEKLYGIQIFTSSPEAAGAAARILEAWNPAVIDINCGCPVPKVIKNGAGAALMKNPELIGKASQPQ